MDSLEWIAELHERYRRTLSFPEIRKGVAALSRIYVAKRDRLREGAVFEGAAKRAAFACFYSPLHFLLVREVLESIRPTSVPARVFDLGCGLGVAGAAWATACGGGPRVIGFEKSAWAAAEARWLFGALGIRGVVHRRGVEALPVAGRRDAVVAAFVVNELSEDLRRRTLERLLAGAVRGALVLVVEPIARRPTPWWSEWSARFLERGGRDDEWRFGVSLPEPLAELDRAAGLDHRELTARSLFVPGARAGG